MLYQILPKKEYHFDQEKMIMFFKTISTNQGGKFSWKNIFETYHIRYIIDCDSENKISIYLDMDEILNQDAIINAVTVMLSDQAVIFPAERPLKKHTVVDTLYIEDRNKKRDTTQLVTFSNEAIFMNILGMMSKNTRIVIGFKIKKVAANIGTARMFSKGSTDVLLECGIQVTGYTKFQRNHVKDVAECICSLTASNSSLWIKYKNSFHPVELTGSEAINLIQIPTLYRKQDEVLSRIYHLLPGQITLKKEEYAKGIYVGNLHHPIQKDRKVYISLKQARNHTAISGTTGSGKSSEIEEWIEDLLRKKLEDINAEGFTFLDPLESSALGVIDKILKLQADGYDVDPLLERTHYIDFSYDDCIFPISLLDKNADITETIDFFKSLYGDQNTIQVDRMLSSAIRALMLDNKEHTLFDVEEIFSTGDATFREELIESLAKNIYAKDELKFLKNTKFNQNNADPILNRLSSFKNTPQKKLMFSLTSPFSALKNIRKWMDEGHIVLFNLKSMSQFDIKVVIGYIATQYYLTAKERPDNSMLHLFIVDESQNVQLPIFAKIGSESRKPGLGLVLMTQMFERYNADFLESIMGNINTLISFKQKAKAALELQRRIPSQDVGKDDLMKLPSMVGYLSMEEGGKEKSILIKAKPPYRYTDGKLVDYLNQYEVEKNVKKNRDYARMLMKRDFISRKEAEKLVFNKDYFEQQETLRIENNLEEGEEVIWEE